MDSEATIMAARVRVIRARDAIRRNGGYEGRLEELNAAEASLSELNRIQSEAHRASAIAKPQTVRVPAAFFKDHEDRDCEPYCEPVKRTGRYVVLRLDDPGLRELLDDARHYADPSWSMEQEYFGLKRSAVATVKAIEAAGVK